jgi:hypothetical protein
MNSTENHILCYTAAKMNLDINDGKIVNTVQSFVVSAENLTRSSMHGCHFVVLTLICV